MHVNLLLYFYILLNGVVEGRSLPRKSETSVKIGPVGGPGEGPSDNDYWVVAAAGNSRPGGGRMALRPGGRVGK